MKLKHFVVLLSIAAFAASCNGVNGPDLGIPNLRLSSYSYDAPKETSKTTLKFYSNRPWNAVCAEDWIAVNPKSGAASPDSQSVTITLLDNASNPLSIDRDGTISFENGFTDRTFTVSQKGNVSPEELIRYFNDFDVEDAVQGTSWPMLDKTDCWKNETGMGTDNVEYASKTVSARANSSSSGSYSDYEGSGHNNLFFGSDAYFMVKNIALGGHTSLKLSFGSEKYLNSGSCIFTNEEFPVYLSNDGVLWVTYSQYVFAGTEGGRWNLASGTIEVPQGTENLYICFQPTVSSAYRLDDLKLESVFETGATAIDFTKGEKKDFGGGSAEVKEVTLAEFIAASVSTSVKYKFTAEISEIISTLNSVNVKEGETTVQLYQLSNFSDYADSLAVGKMITATGYRSYYASKSLIEMTDGVINSVTTPGPVDVEGAWSHTLASGDLAQGDVTLSKLAWNVNVTSPSTPYFGFNALTGVQVGARSNYATSIVMTTERYVDPVNRIVVTTSGKTTFTLNAKVNGVDYGTKPLSATSTAIEFAPTGDAATGTIVLTWTASGSPVYIKSLSINPEN